MAKSKSKKDVGLNAITQDSDGVKLAASLLDAIGKGILQRESQAEQRVRFFLSLATGSIGLLALIPRLGNLGGVDWYWVTIVVLSVLLLFGLETVQSLNWKHIYTRVDSKLGNSLLKSLSEHYPL